MQDASDRGPNLQIDLCFRTPLPWCIPSTFGLPFIKAGLAIGMDTFVELVLGIHTAMNRLTKTDPVVLSEFLILAVLPNTFFGPVVRLIQILLCKVVLVIEDLIQTLVFVLTGWRAFAFCAGNGNACSLNQERDKRVSEFLFIPNCSAYSYST